jgi:S1-C subfamily serine protease
MVIAIACGPSASGSGSPSASAAGLSQASGGVDASAVVGGVGAGGASPSDAGSSAAATSSDSVSGSPGASESESASAPASEPDSSATVGGGASASPAASGDTAAGGGLDQLQQGYERVVNRVSPSVVVIETSAGLGSGVVFDSEGDITTNAHVVGDSTTFQVTLADGRQFPGKLVGTFPANDLAVIKISAPNLQPATFADSSKLQVGQIVMAVGNPLGLQSSVTQGIVSALGRDVAEPGGVTLPGTIQTSAAINPGNSGGALVDINGDVVGIPTLAAVDQELGGSAPGIGFAIPSNDAKDFAGQLIKNGKVTASHRAYLGIQAANVTGDQGAPQGVLVYAVESGGPAAKAGIKQGDLITSVDGKPVGDTNQLSMVLATLEPGKDVAVVVQKDDGSQSTVHVTLGQIPG